MAKHIIHVQPTQCMLTGEKFTEANHLVVLKSGVAYCRKTVDGNVNDSGFVSCPLSEYAYSAKSKTEVFQQKELLPKHVDALDKRCADFEKSIEKLYLRLDKMVTYEEPEMNDEESKLDYLAQDDISDVDDDSDDDTSDFSAFESGRYAMLIRRLKKLKAHRDNLEARVKANLVTGKKLSAPWVDADWSPPAGSIDALAAANAGTRRSTRNAEREERRVAKEARRGSNQVVHNVHVLKDSVPKKWWKDNPNAPKPADWAEKERAKKGWLTEEEQDELEEEEQDKLKEQRIAAWRATQSPIPVLEGSTARQRWAMRLYRLPKRKYYIEEKTKELEAAGANLQVQLWNTRLKHYEARLEPTRKLIAERITKQEAKGDAEALEVLKNFFVAAEETGQKEVEDTIAAKKRAEEEAKKKAEAEAEAAKKAEAKAKAKAEAEARGEEYVDPDEGDEEEDDY